MSSDEFIDRVERDLDVVVAEVSLAGRDRDIVDAIYRWGYVSYSFDKEGGGGQSVLLEKSC